MELFRYVRKAFAFSRLPLRRQQADIASPQPMESRILLSRAGLLVDLDLSSKTAKRTQPLESSPSAAFGGTWDMGPAGTLTLSASGNRKLTGNLVNPLIVEGGDAKGKVDSTGTSLHLIVRGRVSNGVTTVRFKSTIDVMITGPDAFSGTGVTTVNGTDLSFPINGIRI